MTTFYWTDDQLNRWNDTDGVTSYGPPGGPDSGGQTAVAVSCKDGAGGVVAFGVTENRPTFAAIGWRTTDTLVETNDFWLPEDSVGEYTMPGGDKSSGFYITAYDSSGATYDPVTGHIYVTGIFRRYAAIGGDEIAEHNMLVIDPATDTIVDSAIVSTDEIPSDPGFYYVYEPSGVTAAGQCVIGRKLYYFVNNGAQGVAEFDMDTYETRIAVYCFENQQGGDLCARPGDSTGLWIIDRTPYDVQKIYLRRYEIEDLPWFTSTPLSHIPAVESESILLFDEDTDTPVISECEAMAFLSANEIVYWGYVYETGQASWWRQVINPLGAPQLLVDLGPDWFDNHSAAYSMWATAAPVPDIRSSTHPARLRWSTPIR